MSEAQNRQLTGCETDFSADDLDHLLCHTFDRILALTETLTDAQRDLAYHPGVNPPVWELGHSAFFYEWFILKGEDGRETYDPALDDVWDSFQLAHQDRWNPAMFPDYAATRIYAETVRNQMRERLASRPLTAWDRYLTRYAIYHQNMHIESMIWARQMLGYPPPPGSHWLSPPDAEESQATDVTIPAGRYFIGQARDDATYDTDSFGFDNEKPGFSVELAEFRISRDLVSCRDYLAFIEDGGYQRPELWSQGGRRWLRQPRVQPTRLQEEKAPPENAETPQAPRFWQRNSDGNWQRRVFDRWLPANSHSPVLHLSYWEAEAFCAWAGRRLPTEFEWEAAALGRRDASGSLFPGDARETRAEADLDGRYLGQSPVSAMAELDSGSGCRQMIGTCWEWTSSQFFPYDGFTMDMYPFMSTLQFGDHKTTRGGSCATSSCLIRGTYRQAYYPDRDDVFTGLRTCALPDNQGGLKHD